MEALLVVCLLVVLVFRWAYLRNRFEELEARIDQVAKSAGLGRTAPAPPEPQPYVAATRPSPPPVPAPPAAATAAPPPIPATVPLPPPPPRVPPPVAPNPEPPPRRDWEATIGSDWLNKLGVLVLVIGIALALAYSYAHLGRGGRVGLSLAASLTMLISGAALEHRDRYQNFARGLIAGGWSALYFTVYAMQAIDAARVIHNAWFGGILLLAVAAGMILHSLKYRSEATTALAYVIGFVTLAITPMTPLSLIALLPLAGSLLYLTHRFQWSRLKLFALVAAWAVCASRPDTGAPLWQAQAVFAVYWLLFEIFDILRGERFMLPINALGFLTLSLVKWHRMAPDRIWEFLAAMAVAYLGGAVLRSRRAGEWRPAITLTAALGAAAIRLKLDDFQMLAALAAEAELFFLAGLALGQRYLRQIAAALFAVQVAYFGGRKPDDMRFHIAAIDAALFYLNRVLRPSNQLYGYAGAAMATLFAFHKSPDQYFGIVWFIMGAVLFSVGWLFRQLDFRIQGYALALIGALGIAVTPYQWRTLAIAATLSYAGAICAVRSDPSRFAPDEANALRWASSLAATVALVAIVWLEVPGERLGLAWMALALPLLELGLRGFPSEFRWQAWAVAALGAARALDFNLLPIHNTGPIAARIVPVSAALLAYAIAARDRQARSAASFCGTGFLLTGLWALLPPAAVGPAWAAVGIALAEFADPALRLQGDLVAGAAFIRLFFANFDDAPYRLATVVPVLASHYYLWSRTRKRFYLYTAAVLAAILMRFELGRVFAVTGWAAFGVALLYLGRRWDMRDLRWQGYALAAAAFARCWFTNFYSPEMFAGIAGPVLTGSVVIACLYAAQLLDVRGSRPRLVLSIMGTLLLAALLYYQVSGSALTVAWGLEGMALLGAGFPLGERVLRLSGLALLAGCIGKLFVWDLRHLDTLPRIVSFLALGLILVTVSYIYTRFRERVARYL